MDTNKITLANTFHTLKLYYPSMDKNNQPIESLKSNTLYKSICSDICKITGGLTVYPAEGLYLNSAGILIKDDISVISTYTNNLESTLDLMRKSAFLILESLDQESVLIEYDNTPIFIDHLERL